MLGGVSGPTTGSLRIRKTPAGVQVEGEAPERHEFPVKFLTRELNDCVRVHVTVADLTYEVTQIGKHGWTANRINRPPTPRKRRRWWHRRKK